MFDRFRKAVSRLRRLSFERLRAASVRHATRRILVLGDSHVRVFEHWSFVLAMPRTRFDVVYVPGATALGIENRKSQTAARLRFDEALATRPRDLVIVGLGEVDADYAIWLNARFKGEPPEAMLERSLERYFKFLEGISRRERVIVLAASLPTVTTYPTEGDRVHAIRSASNVPHRDRMALALAFNARVAQWCGERGILYIDSGQAALGRDGFVRPQWRHRDRLDHHYFRPRFARWLIARLWLADLDGRRRAP